MKNIISERELKRMVKKVVKEEKLNKINESYDNYMGDSIFDDIESDIMEMSKEEILDYLDEIINFCINKQEDLGYDSYMDDVHEEEKWIQKAIKKPGSLRRKMGKKEGEKISKTDIKNKLASLRAKDEDPTKKGVQGLGKRDLKTYRQLNLVKTLKNLK